MARSAIFARRSRSLMEAGKSRLINVLPSSRRTTLMRSSWKSKLTAPSGCKPDDVIPSASRKKPCNIDSLFNAAKLATTTFAVVTYVISIGISESHRLRRDAMTFKVSFQSNKPLRQGTIRGCARLPGNACDRSAETTSGIELGCAGFGMM